MLAGTTNFGRLPGRLRTNNRGTTMDWLLQRVARFLVQRGNLTIVTPSGRRLAAGNGIGQEIRLRITTKSALAAILRDPELKIGECYVNGTLVIERGSIADALAVLMGQGNGNRRIWVLPQAWARYLLRKIKQFNPRPRARSNVAHHYDLDSRLYSVFLDADRQYSCAYFEYPGQSLDDAQLAKKRRLAAKLLIEPGQHVLDIGSGFGGLALYLAENTGAKVTGLTLSEEQWRHACSRASERWLTDDVAFRLQDYRDISETFARIVSVGMFEHVGIGHYDAFFGQCARLLDSDGVMVLHSIGRSEGPAYTSPWIAKYIFPGGYIPALSEVLSALERAGFLLTDVEILRLHYAETLKSWRERFLAHRNDVERLFDHRFVRMWEFYLAASEMAFREQNLMVFQLQMTKQQGVVPITRDYVARMEDELRGKEAASRPPLRLAGE